MLPRSIDTHPLPHLDRFPPSPPTLKTRIDRLGRRLPSLDSTLTSRRALTVSVGGILWSGVLAFDGG